MKIFFQYLSGDTMDLRIILRITPNIRYSNAQIVLKNSEFPEKKAKLLLPAGSAALNLKESHSKFKTVLRSSKTTPFLCLKGFYKVLQNIS